MKSNSTTGEDRGLRRQGTVQYPNGTHVHRYPNGNARTHNFSNPYNKTTDILIGGTVIVISAVAVVVIVADDASGIGVADNGALPVLFGFFSKGVEMVAG